MIWMILLAFLAGLLIAAVVAVLLLAHSLKPPLK